MFVYKQEVLLGFRLNNNNNNNNNNNWSSGQLVHGVLA